MFFLKPNVEKLKEKGNVEGLIKALKYKDPSIRRKAANALGELKAKESLDALIDALADEDVKVRLEVVRALGRLGDSRAVEALINVVKGDESLDVKLEAIKSLKSIGYSKTTELLVGMVSKSLKVPKDMAEKIVKEGRVIDMLMSKRKLLDKFLK